jgi:hypothetical protein
MNFTVLGLWPRVKKSNELQKVQGLRNSINFGVLGLRSRVKRFNKLQGLGFKVQVLRNSMNFGVSGPESLYPFGRRRC